jgi:hypothetical protein
LDEPAYLRADDSDSENEIVVQHRARDAVAFARGQIFSSVRLRDSGRPRLGSKGLPAASTAAMAVAAATGAVPAAAAIS